MQISIFFGSQDKKLKAKKKLPALTPAISWLSNFCHGGGR
jgi:hypothetical protein